MNSQRSNNVKRIFSSAALGICVIFTLAVSSVESLAQPDNPACGTDQAMARMSKESRGYMIASSTAAQANELLIYLNFDGAIVRFGFDDAANFRSSIVGGNRNIPAASLTQSQKDEVLRLVRDDYSPFNIRMTTDFNEFLAYPSQNREMVMVTTNPSVAGFPPATGGVSPWAGHGFRIPNSISFVFASLYGSDMAGVASTTSHESGHQLGLGHQHLFNAACGSITEYHPGFGSGPLAFSPIMGSGLAGGVANWFAQPCTIPLFGGTQNDYESINSQVSVKDDDFPDTAPAKMASGAFITGFLEREGDVDYLRINFRNLGPVSIVSDNIDLKVSVLTGRGTVTAVYNDPDTTNVTIPSIIGMRYYLRIEAESNANMSSEFMRGTYTVVN